MKLLHMRKHEVICHEQTFTFNPIQIIQNLSKEFPAV